MRLLQAQRPFAGYRVDRKKAQYRATTYKFTTMMRWFRAGSGSLLPLSSVLTVGLIVLNVTSVVAHTLYSRFTVDPACEIANQTLRQLGLEEQACTQEATALEPLSALLHLYPYEPSTAGAPQERSDWWVPWPNNYVGRLGWYRQGLREVENRRTYIWSLATEEVPAILIAAAIANQGNSPQRPFGWAGLEHVQRWLGKHFEWRLALWQWAKARWENHFEEPSIGIGQIQPDEALRLAYAGDRLNLFDDRVSIALMQAKLVHAAELLAPLDLNVTDRFALIALSNNDNSDGRRIFDQFVAADHDLHKLLAEEEALCRQLARMMTYIEYLHAHEDWMLPDAINVERLWWYIDNATAES